MRYIIIIMAWLCCLAATAQPQNQLDVKRDLTWVIGYDTSSIKPGGNGIVFDFNTYPVKIYPVNTSKDFYISGTTISNDLGKLQLYSNGQYIANKNHLPMKGGEKIDGDTIVSDIGSALPQGTLVLPWPSRKNIYVLFYANTLDRINFQIGAFVHELNYAEIDLNLNGGLGQVVKKDIKMIKDTLIFGHLSACRHANGRDWWVIVPEYFSKQYYLILLDPEGPMLKGKYSMAPKGTFWASDGQSCFSPDGSKYAILQQTFFFKPDTLRIYDFDRCTGLLSNGKLYRQPKDSAICGGLAFSPNSRYLYHAYCDRMFQYDIQAKDIAASRQVIAWNDGFGDPLYNSFYKMQLAPDGRIYMSSNNGTHHLHRIDHPNRAGAASEVCQHCIYLPGRNFCTVPNMPNYRLGPLDGSACDSLGINNVPLAGWRQEAWGLSAEFISVSWFEPEKWLWDFGDGSMSSDTNPLHTFTKPGTYNVCLTVSNPYGSNTLCRDITVMTVPVFEPTEAAALAIWPNPANTEVYARAPEALEGRWFISDLSGRTVQAGHWSGDTQRFDVQGFVTGVYMLTLIAADGQRMLGKVVVMR